MSEHRGLTTPFAESEITFQGSRGTTLTLRGPVLIAAGCAGDCTRFPRGVQLGALGAVTTHSITLHSRRGWPLPRFQETAAGLLYAGGLPNPGVRVTLRDAPPVWSGLGVPVIVSIAAESIMDYVELATEIESAAGVCAIEMNLDWPGTDGDSWQDRTPIARITEAVASASSLPLIVKLSASDNLLDAARAAEDGGADAVTVGHGWPAQWIGSDGEDFFSEQQPRLAGPAILPLTLRAIADLRNRLAIGVIASGGISSPAAALSCLAAGASAVEVGSALFRNPNLACEIAVTLSTDLSRRH